MVMRSMAEMLNEHEDTLRADSLLTRVSLETMKNANSWFEAKALDTIINIIEKRGGAARVDSLLKSAIKEVGKIEDRFRQVLLLWSAASAISELNDNRRDSLLILAVQEAQKIDSSYDKTIALTSIAREASYINEIQKCDSILTLAVPLALSISDLNHKAEVLENIAELSIKCGHGSLADSLLMTAIGAATNIEDDWDKKRVLKDIARTTAKLDNPVQCDSILILAIKATEEFESYDRKSGALESIAEAALTLSDTARVDALLSLIFLEIDRFDRTDDKADALYSIAKILIKSKKVTPGDSLITLAIQEAEKIDSAYIKMEMLCDIAESELERRNIERCDSIMRLAIRELENIKVNDKRGRFSIASPIVDVIFQFYQSKRVDSLLTLLFEAAETNNNQYVKASAAVNIIEATEDLEDSRWRDSLIAVAIGEIAKIEDPEVKAYAYYNTIRPYDYYDFESIEPLLSKIIPNINDIDKPHERANLFQAIGVMKYENDDTTGAKAMVLSAFESATQIDDENEKSRTMGFISHLAGELGNIQLAHDAAYSVTSPGLRVQSLLNALNGLATYESMTLDDGM
jgi:hypothetical protein